MTEAADSIRFWTGRHVIDDLSVCYRSAWESARPTERLVTFAADNPLSTDWDWPYRCIDHVFVRSAAHGAQVTSPGVVCEFDVGRRGVVM